MPSEPALKGPPITTSIFDARGAAQNDLCSQAAAEEKPTEADMDAVLAKVPLEAASPSPKSAAADWHKNVLLTIRPRPSNCGQLGG